MSRKTKRLVPRFVPLSLLLIALGAGSRCGSDPKDPQPLRADADGGWRPCASAFAGCKSFRDGTSDQTARLIRFGESLGESYQPQCLRIKASQAIRFQGDFGFHPLEQACGPVHEISNGTDSELSVTLSATGLYGYYCTSHGASTGKGMAGAIEVVF